MGGSGKWKRGEGKGKKIRTKIGFEDSRRTNFHAFLLNPWPLGSLNPFSFFVVPLKAWELDRDRPLKLFDDFFLIDQSPRLEKAFLLYPFNSPLPAARPEANLQINGRGTILTER
jgi:hypothetical protein